MGFFITYMVISAVVGMLLAWALEEESVAVLLALFGGMLWPFVVPLIGLFSLFIFLRKLTKK